MAKNNTDKNGVTNLSVKSLLRQARASLEEKEDKVDTKKPVGKMFIRTVVSRGKRYQQVCRHYYDKDGRRRLELAKLVWPERDYE